MSPPASDPAQGSSPGGDASNGYEAVAGDFMSSRSGTIGVATVRRWARLLPPGGAVLDLGCGHGVPVSAALLDEGLAVHGVDASGALIAEFRARFPQAPAEQGDVETSPFFDRRFDGVIAWGLVFLLDEEAQGRLIRRVAGALEPGGRFLFTAPHQVCGWRDVLTSRESRSLGSDGYRRLLEAAGLVVEGEEADEGGNHYFLARRPEGATMQTREEGEGSIAGDPMGRHEARRGQR